MTRTILAILAISLTVSACGRIRDSRVNPFNWFGRDRAETVAVTDEALLRDPRPFVAQVVSLKVEPTPEGAIIRAVGLPSLQGYWNAELLEVDRDDLSTLTYEFRVSPPVTQTRQSTQRSREIFVARAVSTNRLNKVRTITVIGQSNRRAVQR
ncbi:hypothetical protein SAMN05444273_102283 [Litoreibacter ascidiaceicola]|uniref:Lipoprotein n=1 Tax=Litoreibacter ascidiaceicola TaxID=1486859 RepID=A0A1M4VJS5_9RHOB|nr:hypothetical protein [Litoreibacter ascidiaceicola]SHE69208.1 hypothetical protein SAMN05444273_102283 [Litoreibacter ascidiaceicola]